MDALLPLSPLSGLLILTLMLWLALFLRRLLRDPDAELRRAAQSAPEPPLDAEEREALLLGLPRKPVKLARRKVL